MTRVTSRSTSFNQVQSQQPQTLAFALADSPVGPLAWNEAGPRFGCTCCRRDDNRCTQSSATGAAGETRDAGRHVIGAQHAAPAAVELAVAEHPVAYALVVLDRDGDPTS
ncbi:hypothetical protein C8054_19485 [Micromonospora sp. RP3T]|nr:hypothetical protein C8054_19485 [Micromonospora sp. RP3T]